MRDVVGWVSSLILLLTLGKQIHKQWSERSSRGVSKWLYIGQTTANLGFMIYSWMLGSWIFLVTNLLLVCSSAVGIGIMVYQRRQARSSGETPESA